MTILVQNKIIVTIGKGQEWNSVYVRFIFTYSLYYLGHNLNHLSN